MNDKRQVAYFSMEIGISQGLPTYSGGLGVLAGDTLKSMADMDMPVAAMSLIYHKGYFRQELDASGKQSESPVVWNPEEKLVRISEQVEVQIEGRTVKVGAWKYNYKGVRGTLPVYFLDTRISGNSDFDLALTDTLYGGDNHYRLCQEVVLGQAGVKMLEKIYPGAAKNDDGMVFHMNEGHAALLVHELLMQKGSHDKETLKKVASKCVFTTHTPVAAGHDAFDEETTKKVIGSEALENLTALGLSDGKSLNMTKIALGATSFVNGVAKRHGEVSRGMFPGEDIKAITNGVHAISWTSQPIQKLFDETLPGWREDNNYLRYAIELDEAGLEKAHKESKIFLFNTLKEKTGIEFDPEVFTIGFARRAAPYKRADLLFYDAKQLVEVAKNKGKIQIVFAGKAHPKDEGGKKLIENVFAAFGNIDNDLVKAIYVPNYDMDLGLAITSGVDLWLNNPLKPLEASGTSGMKAALNGVPSFSTLDGWWVEGHFESVTGWEIEDLAEGKCGSEEDSEELRKVTAASLYQKLSEIILPAFYENPSEYRKVMKNSISMNGSFFNTQRMVQQYFDLAYSPLMK